MCLTVFSTRERCSNRNIIGLKYSIWVPYKTDVGNFFAYVIMFFPTYAVICLGNCPVSAQVRKAVYLFNMYSNRFVNIQNIQLLILSSKMHSLEISYLQKMKIKI